MDGAATTENSVEATQKIKNRTTIQSSNPTSGYSFIRDEISISKRYLHSQVHRSIIYSSQEVKTTQMSINRQMYNENVDYTYDGILFSH